MGTARGAPGLGLKNRGQRLFEYGERRASILGCRDYGHATRLSGRKRRRGVWDVPLGPRRLPNAVDLAVIYEEDEDEVRAVVEVEREREEVEKEMMAGRTVVFDLNALKVGKGLQPGYVDFIFSGC
jgi:hypothetical protein